jgi:hypothetical protein
MSTGNAKQTSSCWIHCSVRTTRIRTKNQEVMTLAKVSLQFFTVFLGGILLYYDDHEYGFCCCDNQLHHLITCICCCLLVHLINK